MYDTLHCRYPLPVAGANAREYQTKDTPCLCLNQYEITENGALRHRNWDADRGVTSEWFYHPDFNGEIRFYDYELGGGWIEFSAYFVNGVLQELRLIRNTIKTS